MSVFALRVTAVLATACGVAFAVPAQAEPPGDSATPANLAKLYRLLSKGYGPGDCKPMLLVDDQTAALDCGENADAEVLLGVVYALYPDAQSLQSGFSAAVAHDDELVACPGLDGSPTVWHYHDRPEQTAGSLSCGNRSFIAEVVWTDDANLMLATAQSLDYVPPLYEWWRTSS